MKHKQTQTLRMIAGPGCYIYKSQTGIDKNQFVYSCPFIESIHFQCEKNQTSSDISQSQNLVIMHSVTGDPRPN